MKAEAVRKTLQAEAATNLVPATTLKYHDNYILYVDADSAKEVLNFGF